jgi:two-component system osmolarity sensor histidine kinase EnvZ
VRVRLPDQTRVVRKVLPRTLLGRTLLIVYVPLALVLAVALQIFYGSHINLVSRRMSASVAGEIAMTLELLQRYPDPADRAWVVDRAWRDFGMVVRWLPGAHLAPEEIEAGRSDEIASALHDAVGRPFAIGSERDAQDVHIRIQLHHGVLDILAPRKRIYVGTLFAFVAWVAGTALLLSLIAALFMRIQVRAIRRLAVAAEAFGMGRDRPPIKPEGAIEVRRAGAAFNRMQERIRRFMQQRTEMLAGVSHDLRTPLTRLRLALAMLPATDAMREDVTAMSGDVEEMERLVESYLAFTRGEGTEQAHPTDLAAMLEDVAASARRAGAEVTVEAPRGLVVLLRSNAVRRALTNLVDNARRHARRVALSAVRFGERSVQVMIDDDGPGIPAAQREGLFSAFASGPAGGTGLGLTIARDIVRAHGGEIVLEDSPLGGLRARVQFPL